MHYAGLWTRFGALLLDLLILTFIGTLLNYALYGSPYYVSVTQNYFYDHGMLLGPSVHWIAYYGKSPWSVFLWWLYFAGCESSVWQATPGKRAVSIYVTDLAGNRISFARATGRYFSKILSGLFLGFGFWMVAFTERKQGLHDMIAKTLVMQRVV